jgi:hypothetical protein
MPDYKTPQPQPIVHCMPSAPMTVGVAAASAADASCSPLSAAADLL